MSNSMHVIDPDDANMRLDRYVRRLWADIPQSHIYRVIRSGDLRVNGKRCSADYRLSAGDQLRFPPPWENAAKLSGLGSERKQKDSKRISSEIKRDAESQKGFRPDKNVFCNSQERSVQGMRSRTQAALASRLPILYEDLSFIAIDKPSGVAVHGGSGISSGVIERLRAARPQVRFLELVHRLDRDTSGVLLIAQKRLALIALQDQWRARSIKKRYFAIVLGEWPLVPQRLSFPLLRVQAPNGDRRVQVCAAGQEAISVATALKHFAVPGVGRFSLVDVRLETGRTHQIRVHLSHAGYAIAGDEKYGDFLCNRKLSGKGFRGMFLHAASLCFHHPLSREIMYISAPLPAPFEEILSSCTEQRETC